MNLRNSISTILCLVFISANAQNPDIDLLKKINPTYPTSDFWKSVSGSTYIFSAGIPATLLIKGLIEKNASIRKKSFEIFEGLGIQVILSEALKATIRRKRPAETYPGIIFPYRNVHLRSFPSGHTSMAFALATSLGIQFKKWYIVLPAYLWAGSVAYSRMYLGVHYPSDVVGGALIGAGSALLAHWLSLKIFKPKKPGL